MVYVELVSKGLHSTSVCSVDTACECCLLFYIYRVLWLY